MQQYNGPPQENPPTNKPCAHVRLYKGGSYQSRYVPLHWLQDWPRALDSEAQYRDVHAYESELASMPIFHCFYSPNGASAQPTFRDVPRLRDWDSEQVSSGVYLVQVYQIVQPYLTDDVRMALVRVRDCGTQLAVPVAWLQQWEQLRVDHKGAIVEKEREWQCYYEEQLAPPKPKWWLEPQGGPKKARVPRLSKFKGDEKQAWYSVQVLQVFEGRAQLEAFNKNTKASASANANPHRSKTSRSADNASPTNQPTSPQKSSPTHLPSEERLLQALEQATAKSSPAPMRTTALATIAQLFGQRHMPTSVRQHRSALVELIDRSLRRGKAAEQQLAARLAPLLVLQLGDEATTTTAVASRLQPLLLQTALSEAVPATLRARCCASLALVRVLAGESDGDSGVALHLMQDMELIFAAAYQGAKQQPTKEQVAGSDDEKIALFCAALGAWSLLLTQCSASDVCRKMNRGSQAMPAFANLLGLLSSQHLDIRMAAGECIAMLLETGRAHDRDFLGEHLDPVIELVGELATDKAAFRAKRDRKAQRSNFRELLSYVQTGQMPEATVCFGKERLSMDSWSKRALYAALVAAMDGVGMETHVAENGFVRDALGMGERGDEVVERMSGPKTTDMRRSKKHKQSQRNTKRGKNLSSG